MYHINVILIFFIVFLAKTRVLTRKSCHFDKKKPRRAKEVLWSLSKIPIEFLFGKKKQKILYNRFIQR